MAGAVAPPETSHPVTVFATSWCPFCAMLISQLRKADLPAGTIEVVDVDCPGAEPVNAWIESVNAGNRIVPTVFYADGSHATNPPVEDVLAKLASL